LRRKWLNGEVPAAILSRSLAMLPRRRTSDRSPRECVKNTHSLTYLLNQGSCDNCRKQLARTVSTHEENSSDSSTSSIPSPVPVEFDEVERLESLQLVSKCLEDIGETPITKRKARSKKYTRDKVSGITALMDKAAISGEKTGDDRKIIEQLKEKFHSTTK